MFPLDIAMVGCFVDGDRAAGSAARVPPYGGLARWVFVGTGFSRDALAAFAGEAFMPDAVLRNHQTRQRHRPQEGTSG